MIRPQTWAAAMLIVISTGLAGCGGGSATPQPSQPTSGIPSAAASSAATGAPSGGPSAAATESNPPGDIPDNQVYVRFTPPGARVSLKVPEGWAQSTAGAATAFSDKLNRIEVVLGSAASAPTAASVSATELPKLQSTVPRFGSGKVTSDHRSAGQVILVTYQGDSAQDPVTGKVVRDAFERYIYYRNGRRLDLTLSGPTNADNVDPWKIVSDSVAWQ